MKSQAVIFQKSQKPLASRAPSLPQTGRLLNEHEILNRRPFVCGGSQRAVSVIFEN